MSFQQLFPVTDSIWICFVVLTLVLFVPILCKRLRFPQIAGLIITGTLIGPSLLNILNITPEIKFFSRIGLLFIMFFAGLEIDLEEMKRNKAWGILFGVLTFAVPWVLCYLSCVFLLQISARTSAILACIMGSHTLISYPIISRYGLGRRKSVTISVAGALVAILLALVVYAVMMSTGNGEFNPLWFILKIAVYITAVILLYPRIARDFFHRVTNSFSHFLFVMILLALSCGLAQIIGLDSIVGAFLAGIVLNRYIPKSSPLMNRLDFVGNTLFVPLFLLGTGLLIDLSGMTGNWLFLTAFAVLFSVGTFGKWLAALVVQKANGFIRNDRRVIFGLSESHAAGALAIAMGAYAGGLMDNTTLSATVLIVLFSCILSNIITENGAFALHQDEQTDSQDTESRLMVMLTGSNTLQALMDTAITLYDKNSPELVGLYVTINGEHAPKYMQDGKGRLEEASKIAASADVPFITHNRLGNNIVDSILHASNEFSTDRILMGLPLRHSIDLPYLDNIISPLNDGFQGQIVLQRFVTPINTIRRIVVLVPGPVLQDDAFEKCMESIYRITMAIGCATEFYGKDQPISAVRGTGLNFSSGRVSYNEVSETADMHLVISGLKNDHLLMIVGPRNSETHAGRSFRHLYERIHMPDTDFSTMLLFPETQTVKGKEEATVRTERDFLKMLRM